MKGIEVKKFRKDKLDKTQQQFADIMKVSLNTIQKWEASNEINNVAIKKLKNTYLELIPSGNFSEEQASEYIDYYTLIDKGEDFKTEGKNLNINISGNKSGGNQNFFNEDRADHNTAQDEIKLKDAEIKRLTNELLDCKNKMIGLLTKK